MMLVLALGSVCVSQGKALERGAEGPDWQVRTSDHFEVLFLEGPEFAAEVISSAERYYSSINKALGFDHVLKKEPLSFWIWDNRLRMYLFPTKEAYVQRTGAPSWSAGFVNPSERTMASFNGSQRFLHRTLPHEMTHILFRELVGWDNPEVPRWLDEGVAMFGEINVRENVLAWARRSLSGEDHIPFLEFNELRPDQNMDGATARLFYAQAASTVDLLLTEYGSTRFTDFLGYLRDGYPLERALSIATRSRLASLEDLEAAWIRFLWPSMESENR